MELVVRYSMPKEDVGNEYKFIHNLHQIGVPKDSIDVDKTQNPPHILIAIHTQETGNLIRTMANIRQMKKERTPTPKVD